MTNQRALLAAIAREHLNIETLESRQDDSHDFHDCAVWCIESALQAAFEAGREAARTEAVTTTQP